MTFGFSGCVARLKTFTGKSEADCGIPSSSSFSEACSDILAGLTQGNEVHYDEAFSDCIQCCAVEAVRMSFTVLEFKEQLTPFEGALTDALVKAYEKHAPAIRSHMETIGWRPLDVEGLNWRLMKVAQGKTNGESSEIRAEITFQTDDGGALRLLCNRDELFDFQWKVNEARNLVSKLPK
ncbi:hypothetical protein QR680_013383 [Steinernema hermaphroditum]|uniref:COMM domain-containing protein n=1 Tax=Steinernema hermaphroditum TaxID=289476 RepID=A0AA39I7Z3_9BILA|nr:hypothetical protein QR680_013383 [Steinernema hermaphroditum]